MKILNKQTVDEILRLTIAYYASGDIEYLSRRQEITKSVPDSIDNVVDVIEAIGRLSYYTSITKDQVYAALEVLGYQITVNATPRINTSMIEREIKRQFAKFWPNRIDDYNNGLLEVNVRMLRTDTDWENYNLLRDSASITDPTCNLIVGFLRAELYLVNPIVES